MPTHMYTVLLFQYLQCSSWPGRLGKNRWFKSTQDCILCCQSQCVLGRLCEMLTFLCCCVTLTFNLPPAWMPQSPHTLCNQSLSPFRSRCLVYNLVCCTAVFLSSHALQQWRMGPLPLCFGQNTVVCEGTRPPPSSHRSSSSSQPKDKPPDMGLLKEQ